MYFMYVCMYTRLHSKKILYIKVFTGLKAIFNLKGKSALWLGKPCNRRTIKIPVLWKNTEKKRPWSLSETSQYLIYHNYNVWNKLATFPSSDHWKDCTVTSRRVNNVFLRSEYSRDNVLLIRSTWAWKNCTIETKIIWESIG